MENKKEELNKFEKMAELYNAQRINKQGRNFTSTEIIKLLKFIPNITNHMQVLLKHKIVIKNLDGSYSFPREPSFWNVIKNCSEECKAIQREYSRRYQMNKKARDKKPETPQAKSIQEILSNNEISLDDIAKFLVSTGNYQVLKKEVSWSEI